MLTNQSIDKTRDLARGLSPVEIEDGLISALTKFAELTARFYKISCVFIQTSQKSRQDDYSPLLSNHLYRITQEAVSNAIRHGMAKQVLIKLISRGKHELLSITDDGTGFKESGNEKPGHGLHNIRFRSRMIGARISISKGRHKGMVVACLFLKRKKRQPRIA